MPYKESTLYFCKNIPRRNAPTMISMSINVPQLYDIIIVKISLFYKFSTYQPFLISIKKDACEIIRNPPQFGVEKHVFDIVQQTVPELLTPCPSGNRTYTIDWYLQDSHAPRHIPAGDYKLQFKLIVHSNITIFGMEVYGSVRNTGIVSTFMTE
uniref:Uncharacterized protein n=1 Tax=Anopheles minimus TaxID=112268 RepID=A0A182WG74_9DIPT